MHIQSSDRTRGTHTRGHTRMSTPGSLEVMARYQGGTSGEQSSCDTNFIVAVWCGVANNRPSKRHIHLLPVISRMVEVQQPLTATGTTITAWSSRGKGQLDKDADETGQKLTQQIRVFDPQITR